MAGFFKNIQREFKRYKRGILFGGAVGAAATMYVQRQGALAGLALTRQGILDNILASQPVATLLLYKVYITYITLGMLIGYLIEKNM